MNEFKLISMPDEQNRFVQNILNEFYRSESSLLEIDDKYKIINCFYDLFTEQMLFNDKLFHSAYFYSRRFLKYFAVLGFAGAEYVFEMKEMKC